MRYSTRDRGKDLIVTRVLPKINLTSYNNLLRVKNERERRLDDATGQDADDATGQDAKVETATAGAMSTGVPVPIIATPAKGADAPTTGTPMGLALPFPPIEMRRVVGPTDPAPFDNPTGALVFPYLPVEAYERVLDFGCGCGRVARQLIQQKPQPQSYLGLDLHPGMIAWCQQNLTPVAPHFAFRHHDVFYPPFNPGDDKPKTLPFPVADGSVTLVNAWSVFTHLTESTVTHYLQEAARVLAPRGVLHSTWFLFDKTDFPMMQEFQNALYINEFDPVNAVVYDRTWLRKAAADVGLVISAVHLPVVRGFQWTVLMTPRLPGVAEAEFPEDTAPIGIIRAAVDASCEDGTGDRKS